MDLEKEEKKKLLVAMLDLTCLWAVGSGHNIQEH
jgi:hypothetical protein